MSTSNLLTLRFYSNLFNWDPMRGFNVTYTQIHGKFDPLSFALHCVYILKLRNTS